MLLLRTAAPCRDERDEIDERRDALLPETLARDEACFELGGIEPARVLGRVVQHESAPQRPPCKAPAFVRALRKIAQRYRSARRIHLVMDHLKRHTRRLPSQLRRDAALDDLHLGRGAQLLEELPPGVGALLRQKPP